MEKKLIDSRVFSYLDTKSAKIYGVISDVQNVDTGQTMVLYCNMDKHNLSFFVMEKNKFEENFVKIEK